MIVQIGTPRTARLQGLGACAGCPCAGRCASRAGLGSLGCSCSGCANAGKCGGRAQPAAGMGFMSTQQPAGLDSLFSGWDWKIWALALAVGFIVVQNLFFNEKAKAKRRALRGAREDYRRRVTSIKEGKA